MTDIAIRVDNLSKLYHLGALQQRHDTLRDALTGIFRRVRPSPPPPLSPSPSPSANDLWALKDVSFEVKRGEVVGIIGRNGAGKSTLLKILSRITEPTSGRAEIHGRVGSLLEVGTGFHPELSGRENIYLNGAILGMKRAEIDRQFDAIVAFAEIERFLDTPVKRYSSGMYVRLAFAVAAHLEPEILLVDEVLAVGDAAFQKKCLGKMGDVAQEGRTILFVSHNMQAIGDLCSRAFLLSSGGLRTSGFSTDVIREYLNETHQQMLVRSGARTTASFRVDNIHCYGSTTKDGILPLHDMHICIDVVPTLSTRDVSVHLIISDQQGLVYLGFDAVDFGAIAEVKPGDSARFTLHVPHCPLPSGYYTVGAYLKSHSNVVVEYADGLAEFAVEEAPVYGNRLYERRWHGQSVTLATMAVQTL